MTKKQRANLIPTESYQRTLDRTVNVDEYLMNSIENNINDTELMYKSILQKGFVRIKIQKDCSKYQTEINKTKRLIEKNHEASATADDEIISISDTENVEGYTKENGDTVDLSYETSQEDKDRVMDSKSGSLAKDSEIDPVYLKSCKFLDKFTQVLDKILFKQEKFSSSPMSSKPSASIFDNRHNERNRKNSIFSTDFNDFKYQRILSKEKSQFEPIHCDFASKTPNAWENYNDVFKEIKFTPLSSLFYPEGGSFSFRNTDAKASIAHFLKKERISQEENTLLRRNVKDQSYDTPTKLFKIHIPRSSAQIFECDSGDIIIFRQDLVHQGCGSVKSNLQYFMYINLIGVERDTNLITLTELHNNYRMNFDKIKSLECFKHIKNVKRLGLFKEKKNNKK